MQCGWIIFLGLDVRGRQISRELTKRRQHYPASREATGECKHGIEGKISWGCG